MSDTNIHDLNVLLEQIRNQNKMVLETMGEMQKQVAKLPRIEESIDELKQDVKVIKAVVTDLSHQVNDHEHRISRLEAA